MSAIDLSQLTGGEMTDVFAKKKARNRYL